MIRGAAPWLGYQTQCFFPLGLSSLTFQDQHWCDHPPTSTNIGHKSGIFWFLTPNNLHSRDNLQAYNQVITLPLVWEGAFIYVPDVVTIGHLLVPKPPFVLREPQVDGTLTCAHCPVQGQEIVGFHF